MKQIYLPIKLPTWNKILAMSLKDRMRVKKLCRELTSKFIRLESDSLIQMESALNMSSTQLCLMEYFKMIQPSTLDQFLSAKKKSVDEYTIITIEQEEV